MFFVIFLLLYRHSSIYAVTVEIHKKTAESKNRIGISRLLKGRKINRVKSKISEIKTAEIEECLYMLSSLIQKKSSRFHSCIFRLHLSPLNLRLLIDTTTSIWREKQQEACARDLKSVETEVNEMKKQFTHMLSIFSRKIEWSQS